MIAEILCDNVVVLKDCVNEQVEKYLREMRSPEQSVSYYSQNRNDSSLKKIEDDQRLGKKAEFVAAKFLHKQFKLPLCYPDLGIYSSDEKNWNADLYENVHVKSCSLQTYRYCGDYSWTFQLKNNSGSGGRDKLFDRGDGWVVFVFMETSQSLVGVVKAVVSWDRVKILLRDPKKQTLKGIKKCLYYKDLVGKNENLE